MNSYEFEKYIKSIENKIYKNAAEAIKEMPAVIKDEAFATTRPESAMKILKKNPMYGKLRDEWLEANIWAFFNSPIYKKGWTDTEYMFGEATGENIGDYLKFLRNKKNEGTYQNNALNGLKNNFREEYDEICQRLGEMDLDPREFEYVGNRTYNYKNQVLINYTNSPYQIEIVWLDSIWA